MSAWGATGPVTTGGLWSLLRVAPAARGPPLLGGS